MGDVEYVICDKATNCDECNRCIASITHSRSNGCEPRKWCAKGETVCVTLEIAP